MGYKVDNAIIMAAGLSSRFAPISYQKPKGLITVRGEVLIERQIKQLREAGINDIIVVVGYKKEQFFYLKDKFGVTIVENQEYRTRNNNSTIKVVAPYLRNSYICSSDNYFMENPFEKEVEESYYAAVFSEGETPEWCIDTDADDWITDVRIGGTGQWYMMGHAFWSEEFTKLFLEILEDVYEKPETEKLLWESIYMQNIDRLKMKIRRYDANMIREFDSLDDLREFDESYRDYMTNVIAEDVLEIIRLSEKYFHTDEVLKIERMGGMTNHSYHVVIGDGEYAFRIAGEGTEELIDREQESRSTKLACDLDIDTKILVFDEKTGVKIGAYIKDAETMSQETLRQEPHLKMAAGILSRLHCCGVDTKVPFQVFEVAEDYEKFMRDNGVPFFDDYENMKSRIMALKEELGNTKLVPCHNDPLCENWVKGADRLYLIDWEYAGMNDALWDVADVAIEADLNEEQEEFLLNEYFAAQGLRMSADDRKRYQANKVFIDFLWSLWGKTRVPFEAEMEDYAQARYERMKKNLDELF